MRLIPLFLLAGLSLVGGENPANWTVKDAPCDRHAELLKQGHLDLGVRVATANPLLAQQFRRAMNSWARIVDLDWHADNTRNCAIDLIDGQSELFEPYSIAARSQMPDRANFQGGIAFNPAQKLTESDLYRISVHEIGHLLGLQHSESATSLMYFLDLEGPERLDPADVAALAKRHKLRNAMIDAPVAIDSGREGSQK